MALPFADGWVAIRLNVAVFFILAVLGLEVFGVILAGYASASKWSLFGAMREAAQVVSYEVPLGMCVVVPGAAGRFDGSGDDRPDANGRRSAVGWFTNWYVFNDPFTFITFWVYFTCATASVNRAPFDLAEAESELVAGFHTEYSGLRWSFFFMAEYGSMFAVSGLAAILFFGGWNGPFPITIGSAWPTRPIRFCITWATCLGMLNFIGKCVFGVTFMMWVRWTLPRLRIDQVMTTCLKYCTPMAARDVCGRRRLAIPAAWRIGSLDQSIQGLVREAHTRDDDRRYAALRLRKRSSRVPRYCVAKSLDAGQAMAKLVGGGRGTQSTGIPCSSCCSRLVACGFAVAVLLTSNIVRMAFYLVLSLAATAGLFFLAGADFVGAMQFMIYVGGTLVLLIFGVMLTAQGPFISMKTSAGDWILGAAGRRVLCCCARCRRPSASMHGNRQAVP